MYKTRLKAWRLHKNVQARDATAFLELKSRGRLSYQATHVNLGGRVVSLEKVGRYVTRNNKRLQHNPDAEDTQPLRLSASTFAHIGALAVQIASTNTIGISIPAPATLQMAEDVLRFHSIHQSQMPPAVVLGRDILPHEFWMFVPRGCGRSIARLFCTDDSASPIDRSSIEAGLFYMQHAAIHMETLLRANPNGFVILFLIKTILICSKAHRVVYPPLLMLMEQFSKLAATFHGPRHPLALLFSRWPVSSPEDSSELSQRLYEQALRKYGNVYILDYILSMCPFLLSHCENSAVLVS